MADTLKVLGQSAPSATTETDLYTVPGATSAMCSSIIVCNRSTAATFRISVAVGGGATANKDYIHYDTAIAANECYVLTCGMTLATTDKVKVYASTGNLSFSLYGVERT